MDVPAASGVRVDQPLDLAAVDRVGAALAAAVSQAAGAPGAGVVLDLSECDFVDAVGYRILTDVTRTAEQRGVPLRIVGAHPDVVRVLGLLDAVLLGDVLAHVAPTGHGPAPRPAPGQGWTRSAAQDHRVVAEVPYRP